LKELLCAIDRFFFDSAVLGRSASFPVGPLPVVGGSSPFPAPGAFQHLFLSKKRCGFAHAREESFSVFLSAVSTLSTPFFLSSPLF